MKQLRVITWPLRVAIAATLGAIVLVSTSAWRATHFDETRPLRVASTGRSAARMGSYRPALVSELDRAVEADPFHPERRRPQIRYELRPAGPAVDPEAAKPVVEQIELVGTVVAAGGRSFAMCQTSAGPRVVHIGEKVAGFTLKSVEQGSAVFLSPAGKVVNFQVKKTGS
jgi:hypothetical protein